MINTTTIIDEQKGTKSATYHYFDDGEKIYHISKFSISHQKEGHRISHTLDDELIKKGKILRIGFTQSRYLGIDELHLKDLKKESFWPPGKRIEPNSLDVSRFDSDYATKKAINELTQGEYRLMLNAINETKERLGVKFNLTDVVDELFSDQSTYGLKTIVMPKPEQRQKRNSNTMKSVHQIFCITKILDALKVAESVTKEWQFTRKSSRKGSYDEPVYLYSKYKKEFGKDSPSIYKKEPFYMFAKRCTTGKPTCIAKTRDDSHYSIWHEFQISTGENNDSSNFSRISSARPDIVMQKGIHDTLFDVRILDDIAEDKPNYLQRLKPLDYVFECKEQEIQESDLEKQIIPYKNILKPKKIILLSKEKVSHKLHDRIINEKIMIVENVKPSNSNLVTEISQVL